MYKFVFVMVAAAALSACATNGQAIKPDKSGYLATGAQGSADKAHTLVADKVDMRAFKPLALVTASDFSVQQVRDLGYFGEVIDLAELQRRVVEKNLQDKIPSINDRIGINNAARYYGKFLWIHYETAKHDGNAYAKLIATDPTTLKDVFVAEQKLDFMWRGVNDQSTWYPLFNSLIDWLKSN
ncbi:MAG: hypothetical protein ACYC9L_03175 [Sulfuricaulis sp.]